MIPGSLEFFNRADEHGCDIYDVSDRCEDNQADNVEARAKLGLPEAYAELVMLNGPPKDERHAQVESDHTLIMQRGDSLHDFDGAFADASLDEQRRLDESNSEKFGS